MLFSIQTPHQTVLRLHKWAGSFLCMWMDPLCSLKLMQSFIVLSVNSPLLTSLSLLSFCLEPCSLTLILCIHKPGGGVWSRQHSTFSAFPTAASTEFSPARDGRYCELCIWSIHTAPSETPKVHQIFPESSLFITICFVVSFKYFKNKTGQKPHTQSSKCTFRDGWWQKLLGLLPPGFWKLL